MRKPSMKQFIGALAVGWLAAATAWAQQPPPMSIAKIGHVFAGGQYTEVKGKKVMSGQGYAEFMIPSKLTSPYPVGLVHGGGHTGAIYMQTHARREGWAP